MSDVHDKGRRELIEAVMADWQDKLGLGGWDIRLNHRPPETSNLAECMPWGERNAALVAIRPDTPDESITDRVVHEFLHVLLQPMDALFNQAADAGYNAQAAALRKDDYSTATEQVIFRLVKALTGKSADMWAAEDEGWAEAWANG